MSSPSTYDEIDLESITLPDFLAEQEKKDMLKFRDKLLEIKKVIDKANVISQHAIIPAPLESKLEEEKNDFFDTCNRLFFKMPNVSSSEYAANRRNAIDRVNNYYTLFFEISSSNQHLLLLNTIDSYKNDPIESYSEKFDAFSSKFTLLENELKDEIDVAKTLNKELNEKAAQVIVSSYANIFSNQEVDNKKSAINWLRISCSLTFVIIIILFLSISGDWFHITTIKTIQEGNRIITQETYNYPNLITKIFIISVSLYLISFSFKQYSINKHLQTLNNHRKNALNSYELFVSSIGKDDTSSKNALMLQVAKAIYENSNTGFLSGKQSDAGTNALTEITKFVSESKHS
jgi:hypothetical protein